MGETVLWEDGSWWCGMVVGGYVMLCGVAWFGVDNCVMWYGVHYICASACISEGVRMCACVCEGVRMCVCVCA